MGSRVARQKKGRERDMYKVYISMCMYVCTCVWNECMYVEREMEGGGEGGKKKYDLRINVMC